MKKLIFFVLLVTILSCSSKDKDFETTSEIVCGNNVVEKNEVCDGNLKSCYQLLGFHHFGMAKCNKKCDGWDISACKVESFCGDGIVNSGEICDGTSKKCSEISSDFIYGEAECLPDCSGWDTKTCLKNEICGNGVIENGEKCEKYETKKCSDLYPDVFNQGVAKCSENCDRWLLDDCVPLACKGHNCGKISFQNQDGTYIFSCGTCLENQVCSSNKICIDSCRNKLCGTDVLVDFEGKSHQFNCGQCQDFNFCNDDFVCELACVGMICGDDHGFDCGKCDKENYCFNHHCFEKPKPKTIEIPEGFFFMGCNEFSDKYCREDEKPGHLIFLSKYKIMENEVTVEDFEKCIDSGVCSLEKHDFNINKYNYFCNIGSKKSKKQPANCVSWNGAKKYCKWIGGDLPTEAQWEKSARGGCEFFGDCEKDARIFPWGNMNASCLFAVMKEPDKLPGCGTKGTFEVKSKDLGKSLYGLYDMSGNVWEWCKDWYSSDFYNNSPQENPQGPKTGTKKILKGGSCNFGAETLRISYRYGVDKDKVYSFSGFRCVFKDN